MELWFGQVICFLFFPVSLSEGWQPFYSDIKCFFDMQNIFLLKKTELFSLKILKPSEKKAKYQYGGLNSGRPVTPPRTANPPKKRWRKEYSRK